MDGFEATQRIRREQRPGTWTPIVAMTANALEGDHERCLAAGMDDYLTKPLRAEELDAVLARWVTGARAPEQPPGAGAADGERTGEPPQFVVDTEVLDRLRREVGDAVVAELLDTFRRHTPERLAALRAAVRARDPAAVGRQAHSLAGSGAAVGAARLTALSAEIQRVAEGGEQAPLDALLESMDDAWEQTREALAAV
jgi:two-component system, sensor histidine kinase and response regulator